MTDQSSILLVEDEENLAKGLEFNLSSEGYSVRWVPDGKKALQIFSEATFDLVILDIMLPYLNGFEVAEQIRRQDPQIPILILTARTGINDRLRGLAIGADDYLNKPFHLEELLLRVKGMLKRKDWYQSTPAARGRVRIGNCEVDFDTLTLVKDDQEINLTAHEVVLLCYFLDNPQRAIPRQELLENVWNIHSAIETRTVDNFVARLRKYLEEDSEHPRLIRSVRGVGYIYEPG